jgi:hypothetical protein
MLIGVYLGMSRVRVLAVSGIYWQATAIALNSGFFGSGRGGFFQTSSNSKKLYLQKSHLANLFAD